MAPILTSRLGLAGIALALLLTAFGIQAARLHHADGQIAAMKAAQVAARADIATHEAAASAISSQARADLRRMQASSAAHLVGLTKRIPFDVPPEADRDCVVPTGFVSLWNAGATGLDPGFPGAASGPEKAASGPGRAPQGS